MISRMLKEKVKIKVLDRSLCVCRPPDLLCSLDQIINLGFELFIFLFNRKVQAETLIREPWYLSMLLLFIKLCWRLTSTNTEMKQFNLLLWAELGWDKSSKVQIGFHDLALTLNLSEKMRLVVAVSFNIKPGKVEMFVSCHWPGRYCYEMRWWWWCCPWPGRKRWTWQLPHHWPHCRCSDQSSQGPAPCKHHSQTWLSQGTNTQNWPYLETAVPRHMDVCDRHAREEDGENSLLPPEDVWCWPAGRHAAELDLLAGSNLQTRRQSEFVSSPFSSTSKH